MINTRNSKLMDVLHSEIVSPNVRKCVSQILKEYGR